MRSNFRLLLFLFVMITSSVNGRNEQPPTLNLGDPAPSLRVREWLKGKPVGQFEKGTVYVVEFWATWCTPCKAAMPRLSKLAGKYKKRLSL